MDKIKMIRFGIVFVLLVGLVFVVRGEYEISEVTDVTVCCEKTNSGLECQDVPKEDCAEGMRAIPTSCESTSFCKGGYCYDSVEGTCLSNTPQMVCNANEGTWSEKFPPQCELGCCVLGDQASFVTLVRCKRLSAFLGLETNFDASQTDEALCILSAQAEEKGACVYTEDFERTCKFTTRSGCSSGVFGGSSVSSGSSGIEVSGSSGIEVSGSEEESEENTSEEPQASPSDVEFYPGKLCSADELITICGMTKETMCVEGKEEVYFKDTCGNPANIYDASRVYDKIYWTNIVDRKDACNADSNNADSASCGNCNYLMGTFCRDYRTAGAKATYGEYICADLNCKDIDGKDRFHGESWCGFGGVGATNIGINSVGSKFYRYLCLNGAVTVEPCADFRQHVCIEEVIETSLGDYSQAACRVNRWQDCTQQTEILDCVNEDKRDCMWLAGIEYVLLGAIGQGEGGGVSMSPAENGSSTTSSSGSSGSDAAVGNMLTLDGVKSAIKAAGGLDKLPKGACVPKNPPGLSHWDGGGSAQETCGQANAACPVTFEKGLVGGDWDCVENCECLPGGPLEAKRIQLCTSMGDCGLNVNWLGKLGYKKGYETEMEDEEDD